MLKRHHISFLTIGDLQIITKNELLYSTYVMHTTCRVMYITVHTLCLTYIKWATLLYTCLL